MKKFLVLCCTLFILLGVNTPVFADKSPFVPSIGVRAEVYIEGGTILESGASSLKYYEEDGCLTEIIVTPYSYKDTIESDESRYLIDVAYGDIIKIPTVHDLDPIEIEEVADNLGVKLDDLVVRDLFDITLYNRGQVVNHKEDLHSKYIELTLATQTLENFVCLLHYKDSKWNIVESARVIIDENHLYLSIDELSPFAIVVSTEHGIVKEAKCFWHWFIFLTTILTAILALIIRVKDKDDDEEDNTNSDLENKDEDKKKKNVRIRDLITVISLILSIIFFILGGCKYCIHALILEIVIVIIVFYYSHRNSDDDDEKEETINNEK